MQCRTGDARVISGVLMYERRKELKEGYFAAALWSIAHGLLKGFELPPYQEFLQQIDGKQDTRTGAQIVTDVKEQLRRHIRERNEE